MMAFLKKNNELGTQEDATDISNVTQQSWLESILGSFGETQHWAKGRESSMSPSLLVEPPATNLQQYILWPLQRSTTSQRNKTHIYYDIITVGEGILFSNS